MPTAGHSIQHTLARVSAGVTGDISVDNGGAVIHNLVVEVRAGMTGGETKRKDVRTWPFGCWQGPFLGAPKGLHNVISSRLFFS